MNRMLIDNWNFFVKPEDTIFVLGDFCPFQTKEIVQECYDKLNGARKILIKGNHDGAEVLEVFGKKNIFMGGTTIKIRGEISVNLNHYPYVDYVGLHDHKFKHLMPKNDGKYLLHCHIHNNLGSWKIKDKMINCTVEHWNYSPISEDDIYRIITNASILGNIEETNK